MKRGGKFLVSTAMLAVAGCGGEQGKLEIRSTPTPLAQGQRTVPYRIAEARGQLARGNVALALEAFRIAQRENPNSADALAGIASCYDQMGRFDLSRRNYEAALALAPSNLEILGAFASSLQLQGRTDEALSVRREIAARSAATAELEQQVAEIPAPMRSAPQQQATPVLATADVASTPAVELPARTWGAASVDLTVATPDKVGVAIPRIETGRVEVIPEKPAALVAATPVPKTAIQTAAAGQTVTIELPPARPVRDVPVPVTLNPAPVPVSAPAPRPVDPAPAAPAPNPVSPQPPADAPVAVAALAPLERYVRPIAEPALVEERGPRLERLSMGEIALITVPKPVWRSATVAQTSRSTTVRFVPLREANAGPIKVRLLNAARIDRLAARTRVWLAARGWRGMSIGNAYKTRARSVILYPANQRALAQRLSAQFGFPIARRAVGSHMIVLLGSDAARRKPLRTVRG